MDQGGGATSPAKLKPIFHNLFVGGQEHVNQYRIPSLVSTRGGTLIAVCDARVEKPGDAPNNIDLVMRRSFDNGKTWSKMKTIFNYPGNEAACDASMVVDKRTGSVWIAFDYAVPEPQANRGRVNWIITYPEVTMMEPRGRSRFIWTI